ncbi:MAG: hypothetical protein ACI9WC_001645 [Arenicella sp.]|jgi:hypothetical protein
MNTLKTKFQPSSATLLKMLVCTAALAGISACSNGEQSVKKSKVSTDQSVKVSSESEAALNGRTDVVTESAEQDLFKSAPKLETVSDDEVAASQEEKDNEEFDEYAYVEDEPSAVVSLKSRNEGYVEWNSPAEVAYTQAELSVLGPDGLVTKHKFGAGEAIVLNEQLEDGYYKWESVVTLEIDPYVRDEMSSVRASGDLEAQQELIQRLRSEGSLPSQEQAEDNRQSGGFFVSDGVATPTSAGVTDTGDGG